MADVRDLSKSLLKSTVLVEDNDYTGPMTKNYKRNGYGEQKFPNGDRYEGNFKNDMFEGRGIYRYTSGNEYDGMFKRGTKEGKGEFRVKQKNGFDVYVGTFKKGLKEGKFTVNYANGDVFTGTYVKDRKSHGKIVYKSGAVYEGPFENGNFSGKGVFTKHGEFTYKGQFKDSKRHGWGVETQGKDYIKAGFEKDWPNGKGVIAVGGKRAKNVWIGESEKQATAQEDALPEGNTTKEQLIQQPTQEQEQAPELDDVKSSESKKGRGKKVVEKEEGAD